MYYQFHTEDYNYIFFVLLWYYFYTGRPVPYAATAAVGQVRRQELHAHLLHGKELARAAADGVPPVRGVRQPESGRGGAAGLAGRHGQREYRQGQGGLHRARRQLERAARTAANSARGKAGVKLQICTMK